MNIVEEISKRITKLENSLKKANFDEDEKLAVMFCLDQLNDLKKSVDNSNQKWTMKITVKHET